MLLNLHLQFHLKNPLCFLPCKVEVRTESGQGPSTRKREAEKVNIPPTPPTTPRKEALLPCWVAGKQRQQNSSSFQKTGLRDSCRSVPGIVLVWLVCFRLCFRRRGAARVLAADSVPDHLDQLQHLFQADVLRGGCLKAATVGGSTPWKSTNAMSHVVFLPFRELVASHFQHTADYILQEERQIMDN